MSRHRPGRFPLATVGLLLIIAAVIPTVAGMLRMFQQMPGNQPPIDPGDAIALAFHPAVMLCGAVGCLLVGTALFRFLFTAGVRKGK